MHALILPELEPTKATEKWPNHLNICIYIRVTSRCIGVYTSHMQQFQEIHLDKFLPYSPVYKKSNYLIMINEPHFRRG